MLRGVGVGARVRATDAGASAAWGTRDAGREEVYGCGSVTGVGAMYGHDVLSGRPGARRTVSVNQ
jgi:hypothetical protein